MLAQQQGGRRRVVSSEEILRRIQSGKEKFIMVHHFLLEEFDEDYHAVAVHAVLAYRSYYGARWWRGTVEEISDEVRVPTTEARRALVVLVGGGFVLARARREGGQAMEYTIAGGTAARSHAHAR